MNFFTRLRSEFKTLLNQQKELNEKIDYSIQKTDNSSQQINSIIQKTDIFAHQVNLITQQIDSIIQNIDILTQQINSIAYNTDILTQKIDSIIQKANIIDRTLNMHSREREIKNKKIKIVFLIHNLNAWYSISQVYQRLYNLNQTEVIVVSINKNFPSQIGFSGEDKVHNFLDNIQIPHIRLSMENSFQSLDILKAITPNIIFRQSQWDNDYPPAFSSENLDFAKLVYISYEIFNFLGAIATNETEDAIIDSLFHRRC